MLLNREFQNLLSSIYSLFEGDMSIKVRLYSPDIQAIKFLIVRVYWPQIKSLNISCQALYIPC